MDINIGEAAKASGASAKMIRYYETIGLIAAAELAVSGYRVYSAAEVSTLRFTGLIVPIGEWVLENACHQATFWPKEVSIAVNVSAVQFRGDALRSKLAAVLARTGLDPHRLKLEITESVLMHDSEHNMKLLHALKDLGVRIALDDFGTGFSSLSYLRLFPLDKLKLDRAFVGDIGLSPQSEAIIRAAGEIGRALSMITTAEGVSTREQLDWLTAKGWSQAQGYLIGRPTNVSEIASAIGDMTKRTCLRQSA